MDSMNVEWKVSEKDFVDWVEFPLNKVTAARIIDVILSL